MLFSIQSDIRLAERRVKGLTTMVDNLEKSKAEKQAQLSAAERDLAANSDDAAELEMLIESLQKELQGIDRQLADKQGKLQAADRQLADLKENMDAVQQRTEELRAEAYRYSRDVHSKVDTLLKDACWKVWSANTGTCRHGWTLRSGNCSTTRSYRQSRNSAEVMHCATMLFLGMVDDATTFAETHGGGSGGSDLKWGRDEDEDNRAWALRCMRMASRMMRPAIGQKAQAINGIISRNE